MAGAVSRFATRVWLIHLLLLCGVVAIVLVAVRQMYATAREEAIGQSSQRLELIAQQTARGIEGEYLSIMQDLDLILRDDTEAAAETQPRPAETQPAGTLAERVRQRFNARRLNPPRTVGVNQQVTGLMWRQLRGRISGLFVVDEHGTVTLAYPANLRTADDALAAEHAEWIKSIKEASMSHLLRDGAGEDNRGYHLIAFPATLAPPRAEQPGGAGRLGAGRFEGAGRPNGNAPPPAPPVSSATQPAPRPEGLPCTVIAVIPVETVKKNFFDPLNDQHVVNAVLLDDTGAVLASMDPRLTGANVLSDIDHNIRTTIDPFITQQREGSVKVTGNFHIGAVEISPRIIAFSQISGLPDRRWVVMTMSPLADAESIVDKVLRSGMLWAIFVSLSVAAILVSTSIFLIRSRMKFERQSHELLTREVQQARQIQMAWLPELSTVPPPLEMFAANLPASHISGDFYNWFRLPAVGYSKQTAQSGEAVAEESDANGKIGIVIGDVTGHGMAAAFLMATTQLLIRTTLSRYQDPGRCLQEVNKQLCTQGFRGQFVTMLVIVLDPQSSSIEIATAGHPPPLVELDGRLTQLEMEPHLVLGVEPDEHYKTQGFILRPGASLLLYTDGVIEAQSASGEQYGVHRLTVAQGTSSQTLIESVLMDVKRFCGDRELLDDVTLVALRTAPSTAT